MTTGPEPEDQDRGRLRAGRRSSSARRPIAAATNRSKTASASSGPGRALGVVLDGLDRLLAVAQPLDRAVVEVDLADPEAGPLPAATSPTTWTSWFWAVTWTSPSSRSWTGWFAPWWPNRSRVVSAPAARATIWWPRQIPSSGRPSSMIALGQRDLGPSSRAGSPGPGRQDHAVDVGGEDVGGRDRVREDPDARAAVAHRADDVRLEAEVDDPDQRPAVLRARRCR